LQIGPLAVDTYQQFATGTLEIQLGGTTVGTQYDQLNVAGHAFLSGDLDVSLIGGFRPNHGDTFHLLTAAAGVVGSFTGGDLPMLSDGLVWSYSRSLNGLSLNVVRADFNHNGVVDAADYVLWRKSFNRTGTGLWADGNGDSRVDQLDYQIWRSYLGSIAGTPPASGAVVRTAVPEPSAAWFFVAAFALHICRNRGRICGGKLRI
jgi:hypothetical protein